MTGRPYPSALRACSACSGDYEDPERTAAQERDDDDGPDHDQPRRRSARHEFPAEDDGGKGGEA